MKKYTKLLSLLLCGALALGLSACGADQPGPGSAPPQSAAPTEAVKPSDSGSTEKKVGKVEIVTEPEKTTYWVGEEFSPEGGVIKVSYRDDTTEEIPMTDPSVEIAAVKTGSAGRKQVKVTFGGKSDSFYVVVTEQGAQVTFRLNYDGAPADIVTAAEKDAAVAAPADPARDGHTFGGWYTDAACTVPYDFEAVVTEPLELYAFWKEDGTAYHSVTYSLNYYGRLPDSYTQQVKEGESAREIALTPKREEFAFDGWYTDEAGTTAFSAGTPVTEDMTVYAKWTKTKSAPSTYVFEAEHTNLAGKEGPGMSGSAAGASMIVNDMKNQGASGGKFVSYLYKNGLALEFYLASSETVTDATLALSIAGEMENINLTPETYLVEVNGTAMNYAPVSLESGGAFTDGIVISGISLTEGANTIRLVTNNSVNPMGEGVGTYQGTAPMVDCIKLTTDAVVIWDGVQGLPVQY